MTRWTTSRRYWLVASSVILAVMLLSGCAPVPNSLTGTPGGEGRVAGFWLGLWHGFILLFTFVVSLFSDRVTVYEAHNSGNLYNLGFLLGVMMFFGGGGRGSHRKSCRD